ncbi:MAG TPA: hypothetical protein VFK13_09130 [Gemmatimonadaceae bacterium]|nr:hypothetical protein [Gemmatimonadaceae bacterium]
MASRELHLTILPQHSWPIRRWALVAILAFVAAVALRHSSLHTGPTHASAACAAAQPTELPRYFLLLDDPHGSGLPQALTISWPPPRAGASHPSERATAVRIGARIVDLDIMAWARNAIAAPSYYGDTAAMIAVVHESAFIAAFGAELSAMLDSLPRGDVAAVYYRRVQDEAHRLATVDDAELRMGRLTASVVRPEYLSLGSWLEAGRVAALRGDSAFFMTPESEAESVAALCLPLPRSARSALQRVPRLVQPDSPRDFAALERAFTSALRAVAD